MLQPRVSICALPLSHGTCPAVCGRAAADGYIKAIKQGGSLVQMETLINLTMCLLVGGCGVCRAFLQGEGDLRKLKLPPLYSFVCLRLSTLAPTPPVNLR
ncbi:hypothetical protein CRENBAI_021868 [Crenichthys baileyi]|uniref:Uncharacterized protein n=1 Tax=Crenichthys baileyi TaxID=28760 RepID=A0AAV9RBQ1_9TELE